MRTPEHGRAPKKPTIDDVARLSGVARTTVSRVLNGGPNVRDPVRRKVLEAVKALDYRVNPQARSLAGGASGVLALILALDLDAEPNSFYASALELGAIRECLIPPDVLGCAFARSGAGVGVELRAARANSRARGMGDFLLTYKARNAAVFLSSTQRSPNRSWRPAPHPWIKTRRATDATRAARG